MRTYTFAAVIIALAVSFAPIAAQSASSTAAPPQVHILKPPDFWGEYAIWGSTGVDRAGHIFFGMTSNDDHGSGSAHLFEFNPATDSFTDVGNVVAELERLGIRRPHETQMKIHSRIVQAADGYQYFASMDETGENDDGSKLPTWGGHLWRRGASGKWEHLAATPHALIAVATGGPYVYSLGYFDHVLYQFDTRTKRIRSATVGSSSGHVSRNFFVDDRGHAFVPRVTTPTSPASGQASLVEFDADLKEQARFPLNEYFESTPVDSHGIVAVSDDGGRGWFFTTGKGRLYHQEPDRNGGSTVTDLGWVHPAGSRYPASMFRDDRTGNLHIVAMPGHYGGSRCEWITRSPGGQTAVAPFRYGDAPEFPGGVLLYGSMTRDTNRRFYVVGTLNYKPVILQVTLAR
jgi:hypothetical protein